MFSMYWGANYGEYCKLTEYVVQFQECLTTAISAHDAQYQTKALVNIASLHLESNHTHQAVVYYEKLLNLQKELQVNLCY